ncbi:MULTISPECIES: hypothetical protein [Bacillus]|uniref:hypothetical protein n=1 Tax=Bacillus TaxID=1386 RepID=UPI0011DFBE29|nr:MULTISPECIES: hypothetical protein [Bacillus]
MGRIISQVVRKKAEEVAINPEVVTKISEAVVITPETGRIPFEKRIGCPRKSCWNRLGVE